MISDGVRNVTTPRLGLNQPTPGGDVDVWGDYLNANMTILDQSLLLAGGTMAGALAGFAGGTPQNPSFATGSGVGLYPAGASLGVSAFGSNVFTFSLANNISAVPLTMNNQRIMNVGGATVAADATNKGYVDTADNLRVLKAGDTMSGPLTINSINAIVLTNPQGGVQGVSYGALGGAGSSIAFGVGSGTLFVYQDGTPIGGLLGLAGGTMSGPIDMGTNLIRNLPTPVLGTDAANKNYVDANSGGGPGGGIPEAPSVAGVIYGRSGQLTDWFPVLPTAGGTMLGPIQGFPGNTANPSINTAPGIGLYPLAGTLGVSVNGTSTFLFSSTGNVSQVSLNMFNNNINNLAAPTANNHAVTLGYLNTWAAGYGNLPPSVQSVPISFSFPGKPPSGAVVNVPINMPVSVPALLAGTAVFAGTASAGNATFTVNRIPAGSMNPTALGTITILPAGGTNCILAGAGGALASGDTLQLAAPTQDATLADLGVSLFTQRT